MSSAPGRARPWPIEPTFAGFRFVGGEDRPFRRLEQRQIRGLRVRIDHWRFDGSVLRFPGNIPVRTTIGVRPPEQTGRRHLSLCVGMVFTRRGGPSWPMTWATGSGPRFRSMVTRSVQCWSGSRSPFRWRRSPPCGAARRDDEDGAPTRAAARERGRRPALPGHRASRAAKAPSALAAKAPSALAMRGGTGSS